MKLEPAEAVKLPEATRSQRSLDAGLEGEFWELVKDDGVCGVGW